VDRVAADHDLAVRLKSEAFAEVVVPNAHIGHGLARRAEARVERTVGVVASNDRIGGAAEMGIGITRGQDLAIGVDSKPLDYLRAQIEVGHDMAGAAESGVE